MGAGGEYAAYPDMLMASWGWGQGPEVEGTDMSKKCLPERQPCLPQS